MPMSTDHKRAIARGVSRAQTKIKERQRCPACDRKGAILTQRLTFYDDGDTITQCRFCGVTVTFEGFKRETASAREAALLRGAR